MDDAFTMKYVSENGTESNDTTSELCREFPFDVGEAKKPVAGTFGVNSKRKERTGDLRLVMEPQNPSPTKYFDNNGVPLRKALEEGHLGDVELEPERNVDRKKGSKVSIECCNCDKTFASQAAYEQHYRTSYQQEPVYACPVCGKRIKQYRAYRLHSYRHMNSAKHCFTCPDCSKTFHQKSDLTRHQNIHLPNNAGTSRDRIGKVDDAKTQPIPCSRCDATFETQAEAKEHTRKFHRIPKQMVECPDCGKSLSMGSLYSHRKIHSESPKFSCSECGRRFVQKINLIQHHKTHLGERPFQCEQCDKAFCEKAHLQRHLNYHSKERPFRCNLCGKSYKTERCLKVHSAVHNNERPFVCPECNKGFLSSSKLRQHSNIHSGLRPFKCKYCTRDFTNFPNWLKHIRRRHKVDHRTGEKLDSVPKFMTKNKKDAEGGRKKEPQPRSGVNEKPRKRTVKSAIPPPEVHKEESLPYFSESSNIDLNLVCKDDLLQPLADEMEDIFQCLPSDESKLSIPEPLEHLCTNSNGDGPAELQEDCDFSVKSPTINPNNLSSDLIKYEPPSNALLGYGSESLAGPLLYDAQLPVFPAMVSFCNDDQQFRLINPHFIHLSNTTFLAGNSKMPPDGGSVAVSISERLQ
ncbi:zinc finger protein 660-like [Anopheles nili]|uniref:zinc finger protein 660-like n=1 Tax=Anopheles nili TaxID=185578 RepID=UPI00237B393E|nr:zinc finger protein 660-like [Anopheles nili]